MRFRRYGGGLALFFSLAVGCSQSSPEKAARTGTTVQGIQGGAIDNPPHPFAVGVCIGNSPGQCQGICSGALILPNLVVTARHCIDQINPDPSVKIVDCSVNPVWTPRNPNIFVTTNGKMTQTAGNVGWHGVDTFVKPTDNHICGHDIALLVLSDLVPSAEATPIVPGVQYPMNDPDLYVHRFTAVGFGNTGPEGPLGVGAGTRRIRGNINILCIPGDTSLPCPMGFNDNEFYGDDGTCEGDSGSSAYDNFLFLQDKAVSFGVLSRGGDNAGDAGQAATLCKGSLYTRLDKYRDLVVQAATTASKNWTLYPKPVPDWTVYVPPKPPTVTPEAGPPKKAPQDDGVGCATNDECKSKLCVDTGAGLACTQPCDANVVPTTCASGFVCKASACVQDLGGATPPPTAAPTTSTTSGCSIGASSRRGSEAPLGLLAAAAAAVLGLGIRRRSARPGG